MKSCCIRRSMLPSLCLLAFATVVPCEGQEKPSGSALPTRDAMLDAMSKIITKSVARRDTEHPVFRGCIDWHSSVHGHWAILRIAHVTGKYKQEAQAIVDNLQPKGLELEVEYLKQHPGFELPYGRAWFLRLALEYETWAAAEPNRDASRLRVLADECALSLLNSYRGREPTPATRVYSNDSWALVQLHAYFKHRQTPDETKKVEQLIEKHFVSNEAKLSFAQDLSAPDFFSRFGNWSYLIAKTQSSATTDAFVKAHPMGDDDVKPVDALQPQAHHLGVNWSRAWALRALSRQCTDEATRKRCEAAYQQHVATGWKHHLKYAGNYGAYDHWVPQFAVYALTE